MWKLKKNVCERDNSVQNCTADKSSLSLSQTHARALCPYLHRTTSCKFQPRSTASLNLKTEIRLPKPLAPSAHCIELLEFVFQHPIFNAGVSSRVGKQGVPTAGMTEGRIAHSCLNAETWVDDRLRPSKQIWLVQQSSNFIAGGRTRVAGSGFPRLRDNC